MTTVNIFALAQPVTSPMVAAPVPAVASVARAPEPQELDEPLVSMEWLERRSRRLDAFEEELRQRQLDLERREAELEDREARFEADCYLREDELEQREQKVAEAEQRLGRRESEIGSYVARLQSGFLRAS